MGEGELPKKVPSVPHLLVLAVFDGSFEAVGPALCNFLRFYSDKADQMGR